MGALVNDPDLDVPKEHLIAVILQKDVPSCGLAEAGKVFEFALGFVFEEIFPPRS